MAGIFRAAEVNVNPSSMGLKINLQREAFLIALVLIFCSVLVFSCAKAPDSGIPAENDTGDVFPDREWLTLSPEEAGLDRAALDSLKNFLGGRGCLVRYGKMVYTWGEQDKSGDVASAAKPVYTHLLFLALREGLIKSLDEPVLAFEPGLGELNPELGYKDRGITWRHLANMVSCYGVEEQPGAAFDYNDFNIALFRDLLFLKIYRTSWEKMDEEVLHPRLTDPLGCQDNPTLLAFGLQDRPGRLGISVRDFARFGLLYLRRGRWRDKQLFPSGDVDTILGSPLPAALPRTNGLAAQMLEGQKTHGGGRNQAPHDGSYSFLWWVNGLNLDGVRHWPSAPEDTYMASGHWGPRTLAVIPSLDLVISWNEALLAEWDWEQANVNGLRLTNEALGLIVRAVLR